MPDRIPIPPFPAVMLGPFEILLFLLLAGSVVLGVVILRTSRGPKP
jgi:hypothetical protein